MKLCFLLASATAILLIGCSGSNPKIIQQKDWGISLEVAPDWSFEFSDSSINISTITNSVKGFMEVNYQVDNESESIDEYFYITTAGLEDYFQGYQKVSDGRSEVNGFKTIWHRMRSTYNENLTEVLVYFIALESHHFITITCVARADKFSDFETDFISMVYSLQRI